MTYQKKKTSAVSILHRYKLIFRSILFILAVVWYVYNRYNDITINIHNKIDVTINMNWAVLVIDVVYMYADEKIKRILQR